MISVQFWYVNGDVCNLGSICFDCKTFYFVKENDFSGKYCWGKISYILFGLNRENDKENTLFLLWVCHILPELKWF